MAGRRTPKTDARIPSALMASSVRYPGKAARIYNNNSRSWQSECYRHYGICGEARFAANFFGHSMSRIVLKAQKKNAEGVMEDAPAGQTLLDELFNGSDGQPQMLDQIGTHLTIAGECYLVNRQFQPEDEDGEPVGEPGRISEVVSVLEMKVTGTQWSISYAGGRNKDILLEDDDDVIRIWISNPAAKMEADSPFRSLLPILNEIEWLTRHVFAQVQSRLAGAGILFLSQNMTFPPPPEQAEDAPPVNEATAFMLALAEGMMKPITDPESPASVIPFVVTVPDDSVDKAKLMHFWSDLDAESKSLRQEAIQRFALGMDLPPEQVLGMQGGGTGGGTSNGVSHWGAWQVEESTIKLHIEPMAATVCQAITVDYLRVKGGGDEVVTADTSALRLRPDRSKEAMELYSLGLINAAAVVRENGFKPTDMMKPDERREWLLMRIASGSATPEQVHAALMLLGVSLPVPELEIPSEPRESRPPPSLEEHPAPKAPPDAAALLAASEGLVFRALERAGNRLRSEGAKPPCPAYETHTLVQVNGNAEYLLGDAWSCAPQVLAGIAAPEKVLPVLDAYVRSLFTSRQPHTRENLHAWLARGAK